MEHTISEYACVRTQQLQSNGILDKIKTIETKLGRNMQAEVWAPRIIDIDILFYDDIHINTERLTIPHKQIKNRDFLQFLLDEIGYNVPSNIKTDSDHYKASNHFVLNPKTFAIVNMTPAHFLMVC